MRACITRPNRAALQGRVSLICEQVRAHILIFRAFLAPQLLQFRPVRSIAYNFEAVWTGTWLRVRVERSLWTTRQTFQTVLGWSLAWGTSDTIKKEVKACLFCLDESWWAYAFHFCIDQKGWTYCWRCFRLHFCHRDGKGKEWCHSKSYYCNRGSRVVSQLW